MNFIRQKKNIKPNKNKHFNIVKYKKTCAHITQVIDFVCFEIHKKQFN